MLFFIMISSVSLIRLIIIVPIALVCIAIGTGFGYIGINGGTAAALIIAPPIALTILKVISNYNEYIDEVLNPFRGLFDPSELEDKEFDLNVLQIFDATTFSLFVFMAFIANFLTKLEGISNIVSILFSIIIVIVGVVNLFALKYNKIVQILFMMMDGCVTVLSLLLIPICETFVSVIESSIGPRWNIILFFVVLNLLFPIILNIALILSHHKSIREKYKSNSYRWFEVADVSQKVVYAILAAYDIPWACAGLQIAWMIVFCIIMSCDSVSDNVLNIGESFVLIIVNILVAVNNKSNKLFPFSLCVGLIVIACLPVVVASYCFFIFDFKFGQSDLFDHSDSDDFVAAAQEKVFGFNYQAMKYLYILGCYGIPVACFLYGINIPLIYEKVRSKDTY